MAVDRVRPLAQSACCSCLCEEDTECEQPGFAVHTSTSVAEPSRKSDVNLCQMRPHSLCYGYVHVRDHRTEPQLAEVVASSDSVAGELQQEVVRIDSHSGKLSEAAAWVLAGIGNAVDTVGATVRHIEAVKAVLAEQLAGQLEQVHTRAADRYEASPASRCAAHPDYRPGIRGWQCWQISPGKKGRSCHDWQLGGAVDTCPEWKSASRDRSQNQSSHRIHLCQASHACACERRA